MGVQEEVMQEPITYHLDHSTSTVDLSLTADRLTVRTQGKGLADTMRIIDIPLSAVRQFAVVPTVGAQNLAARGAYDTSYDSEFIFTYDDQGRVKSKRLFVQREDAAFQQFITALQARRPDASLLHLDPADAQKQMGVLSASKAVWIILAVIVGIPVLIGLIACRRVRRAASYCCFSLERRALPGAGDPVEAGRGRRLPPPQVK
jgi:hypothetical protein